MKNLATTLAVALRVASGNAGHGATASEGGIPLHLVAARQTSHRPDPSVLFCPYVLVFSGNVRDVVYKLSVTCYWPLSSGHASSLGSVCSYLKRILRMLAVTVARASITAPPTDFAGS